MQQSITGNFYDLLNHIGAGHYSKMRRCFQSSLNHFDLNVDPSTFSKYRWHSTHFLNALGLLEIDKDNSTNQSWESCPGYIVATGTTQHRCIGGSILIDGFSEAVGNRNINFKQSGYQPKQLNTPLFPQFPEATIPKSHAQQLARDLNCIWVEHPSQAIIAVAPSMKDATEVMSQIIDGLPEDPALERMIFDREHPDWESATIDSYHKSGLLRRRRYDGRFDYFVVVSSRSRHQLYRINSGDWSQLIALDLLNTPVKCHYYEDKEEFSVPSFLRFPALIQRILVTAEFSMPKWSKNGFRNYSRIPTATIEELANKYPCLKIVRKA